MWRLLDDPQLLKPEYILRCIALRLVLVWFCFAGVDDAFTFRASCHITGSSSVHSCSDWSWPERAGVVGLQLQLALALAGVVWPFVHLPTYERKHAAFQQVLAWGSIAGKVLELVSGVTGDALGRSSEAAMMLHTVLFAAQQYAAYPRHLEGMLVAYSACHALGGRQSLLAAALAGRGQQHDSAAAAAAQLGSNDSSDVAGAIISASASYLAMYMTGLAVFNLIQWYVPSPEQLSRVNRGSHAWSRASHASAAAPDSPSGLRRSMSGLSLASTAPQGSRSNSLRSIYEDADKISEDGSAPSVWGANQKAKFAVVRFVDALFLALLAVHLVFHPGLAATQAGSGQQIRSEVRITGLVAAALAAWQLVHAAFCCMGFPHNRLIQHSMVGQGISFYPAVAGRVWLVLGGGLAIGPGQVFPSLLVVAALLVVHEQPRSLFGLQMAVLAAGARCIHQQLLTAGTLPSEGAGVNAWLPEYAAIAVFLTCVHSCMCLGSQQGAGTATDRSWLSQLTRAADQPVDKASDNDGAEGASVMSAAAAAAGDGSMSSRSASRRPTASPGQSRRPTSSARSSFSQTAPVYARLQVDVGQGAADDDNPPPAPLLAAPVRRPPLKRASFVGPMDAYSNALLVPAVAAKEPTVTVSNAATSEPSAATEQEPTIAAGRGGNAADGTPPSSPRRAQRRSILWADAALLALQEEQLAPDAGPNSGSGSSSMQGSGGSRRSAGGSMQGSGGSRQSAGGSRRSAGGSRQSSGGSQVSREAAASIRPREAAAEQPPSMSPFALASTTQPTTSRPAGASRLGPGVVVLPAVGVSQEGPEPTSCTTPRAAPSRSLSRARSMQRQLSMGRSSCAGAGDLEDCNAGQGHQQQVAYDAILLLLGLVGSCAGGSRLLPTAWHMAAAGSALATTLAMACTVVYMFSSLPCLVYLWRQPTDFLARRELTWPCRLSLGPLAHEFACMLLGLPAFQSPRGGLAFMAACLGLTHTPVPTFARWLPPMVALYFWGHMRHHWSQLSWVRLAVEGVEYNLQPVAAYALTHALGGWLQGQALRVIPLLLKQRGIHKLGMRQWRWLAEWAGAAVQVAVGVFLMVLVVEWPQAMLGSGGEMPSNLDATKEYLLQCIEKLLHADNLDNAVAAVGVLACLWALPAIHLLVVWAMSRYRPSPSQERSPQLPPAEGESQLWGKEDLVQQQRMGMDTVAYIAAWPVCPLVTTPAIIRCMWPDASMSWWHAGFALTGVGAVTACYTWRVVHAVQRPQAAARWRDVYYGACHGGLTSMLQLANALLRINGFWTPLLEYCLTAAVVGIMQISYHAFAVWLGVASTFYFSAHLVYEWRSLTWTVMAAEALEYTLYPSILYGITRMVLPIVNPTAVQYIMNTALQRGYIRTPAQHKQWAVWSAMGSVSAVAVAPLWSIALGARLPAFMDPVALAAKLKGELVSMFDRMGLTMGSQVDTLRTLLAMAGVGVCFLAVSGLQALLLNNPAFRNPRQRWYEACKARVMALGDTTLRCLSRQTAATGPQHLRDTLLVSLQEVLQGCFPGCTVMVVLMEDKGSLYRGMARRYLLQASPEAAEMPASDLLALGELPSVEQACQHGQIVYDSNVRPGTTGYGDWEALAADYGMDGFLTAPLSCAEAAMGALVLAASAPVSIDRYLRRLAGDVAQSLSQTLYTLSCIEQMRAAEQIIHDIMPEKVADELRRRVVSADPSRSPLSPSSPATPRGGGPPPVPIHASSLYRAESSPHGIAAAARDMDFLQARRTRLSTAGSSSAAAVAEVSFGEVPVVYKQWHPAVSVLFADISSYTAMSTQVEPEQVMMLLHELFSKYDNLCSQYGVYKVETIGDCYMACCGLLTEDPDHAANMVQFGQAMLRAASTVRSPLGGSVHIRVGVHSGRVMSGIVGSIRARYCLFGDTVNTASRMESTGVVDRIQVSQDTYQLLGHLQDDFELRTDVSVKGKGVMQTYVLRGDLAQELTDAIHL